MIRKFVIAGLRSFLGGAAGLMVVMFFNRNEPLQNGVSRLAAPDIDYEIYTQAKTDGQLQQEQRERLEADLQKLATGETTDLDSADLLYGQGWRKVVNKYKANKELRELGITVSAMAMLVGLVVLAGCFSVRAGRLVIKACAGVRKRAMRNEDQVNQEPGGGEDAFYLPTEIHNTDGDKSTELPWMRRWQAARGAESASPIPQANTAVMCQSSTKLMEPAVMETQADTAVQEICEPEVVRENAITLEESVEAEKQKAQEFDRLAESVQHAALRDAGDVNGTLKELATQVSAIREYASCQQERVNKLQDGYDWNIIRNFCLRIIRCIDNLDDRVRQLSEQAVDTGHLEDVRDELIFALESSGVEQFEAEV